MPRPITPRVRVQPNPQWLAIAPLPRNFILVEDVIASPVSPSNKSITPCVTGVSIVAIIARPGMMEKYYAA